MSLQLFFCEPELQQQPNKPDREREQARRHPDQGTLELAAAGAAKVLGPDHSATRAFAKAAAWPARPCCAAWIAGGTRGALRGPRSTSPRAAAAPRSGGAFLRATGQTICYHVHDGSYCNIGGVHELP